jgi:pyruvate/2-oxoglutarate dehydrogenase complex dihydrolipoamide acyltransferase (E2) component
VIRILGAWLLLVVVVLGIVQLAEVQSPAEAAAAASAPAVAPLAAAPAPAPAAVHPAPAPKSDIVLVRGTLLAVEPAGYEVRTATGQQRIATDVKTGYDLLPAAALDSVRKNGYVGVAATRQPDGTIQAIDVHIFPDSMRGEAEGYSPWDLPGARQASMTNGTVTDKVAQVQGSRLTLGAKGQEITFTVPPATKVVRVQPAAHADVLRAGYGVLSVCSKGPDGSLHALKVFAGVNGAMPPF